ncbi:MAG: hypothetical protein U1F46_11580 [Marinagarivorans sp.]
MENPPKTHKPITLTQDFLEIVADEAHQEQLADHTEAEFFANQDAANQSGSIVKQFINSYSLHKNSLPLEQWLIEEFSHYPGIWNSDADLTATAREVIATVDIFNKNKISLSAHLDKGMSQANWLAQRLEDAAKANGAISVSQYASLIDTSIADANQRNWDAITRQDGNISQALNLDGFIAEHHHVNTFNINATTQGSQYRARVLTPEPGQPFSKNSMDIGIYDQDGKLVKRYQSKYGSDADATQALFERGDYRGQRKLVPAGHADQNSTETIEMEGIESKPLSKEEAKELQRKAQEQLEAVQYEWNDVNRIEIAKHIGKQALVGACITVGLQGVRILGRRVWNTISGQSNQSVNEDIQEFLRSGLKSTAHVGIQVAISGAVVVIVKNGLLGTLLKATPVGQIVNTVSLGLENIKILFKVGRGEIDKQKALDAMGQASTTAIVTLTAAVKGASIGAALGTVFGPVGSAIGGFIGGLTGGIAGSSIGETIYQGGKTLIKGAAETIKNISTGLIDTGKRLFNRVSNFCSSLFS